MPKWAGRSGYVPIRVLHAAVYYGFSRALNATFTAREVFATRDEPA